MGRDQTPAAPQRVVFALVVAWPTSHPWHIAHSSRRKWKMRVKHKAEGISGPINACPSSDGYPGPMFGPKATIMRLLFSVTVTALVALAAFAVIFYFAGS
jgi:hypothetical protein